MRQPRLGLMRLERQPYTPGESGSLGVESGERLPAV
jgi:hypothetical protein